MKRVFICCVIAAVFLAGCVVKHEDTQKLRDLDFTVLNPEDAPRELQEMISEEERHPFCLTYADQGSLYIAEGYGTQLTTGYSVEVNDLYETEDAVFIHTTLLGPEAGEDIKEISTFPYVVVKLEYIDKNVIFD